MTLLNCGYEKGELIEMDGEPFRVIGEECDDPYQPEEEKEWYPITEPVEEN